MEKDTLHIVTTGTQHIERFHNFGLKSQQTQNYKLANAFLLLGYLHKRNLKAGIIIGM